MTTDPFPLNRRDFLQTAARKTLALAAVAGSVVQDRSSQGAETGAGAPTAATQSGMAARQQAAGGQYEITEDGKPVLQYNYSTVEPGEVLKSVSAGNRVYARARSDYIHPLWGLDGAVLTKDWSVDHPHHRGVYWAWPEVDWRGQRGDLHALQKVFARPTGRCAGTSGAGFAQIEAENEWKWEDREPIVKERAIMRAWAATASGRCIDLEFQFTALADDVALARRETKHYGGLNLRLGAVKDQQILLNTDPATTKPRLAWADLSGYFPGSQSLSGVAVFQNPANPDYPGDWVKYPELNWVQPTFPAAGTRYLLKKDRVLVLRFRLWVHAGRLSEEELGKAAEAYGGKS